MELVLCLSLVMLGQRLGTQGPSWAGCLASSVGEGQTCLHAC